MHALGMGTTGLESYFGPVRNPWNPEHIAGGSSSGSAAAVASGMCYATVDTDAIGSCRLPAACCGVVGFKGTYRLISTQGILEGEGDPGEMIRWFSHPGIMTRAVEDIAVMLDVLATNHECRPGCYFEAMRESRRVRIGVANNFRCDQEVGEAFGKAVELIPGLGYSTKNVAAPLQTPAADLSGIESDRASIAGELFQDVDVLLLPTTTTTVPKIKDVRNQPQALSAEHTVFANYYGLPAISVPCGFDRNGLPLGLQIVSKPWDEVTAIHLANQFSMAATAGDAGAVGR